MPERPKGGDLGFFPRKWMVEEPFAKVAFAMKVGELSDVVVTDYGYHLIQVTDRKPGDATTFEDAQDEVRDCYIEEMKLAILGDLRKSAKIESSCRSCRHQPEAQAKDGTHRSLACASGW